MQVGVTIGGAYVIETRAGMGGMGSVYRARDRSGQLVAIKMLHDADGRARARFRREAQVLQELRHPGIVRCMDAGVSDLVEPFLVMEWLEGCDLRQKLEEGPLALDAALTLTVHVAHALGAAHDRGVVHRDVKPSNIFLCGGDVSA